MGYRLVHIYFLISHPIDSEVGLNMSLTELLMGTELGLQRGDPLFQDENFLALAAWLHRSFLA